MLNEAETGSRTPWPIRGVVVGAVLILTGYLMAFGDASVSRTGAFLLALGNALLAPAAIGMGVARQGRWARKLRVVLWIIGAVILTAMTMALLLPDSGIIVLGFPLRVAVVLYGAGVLPLLVLPALFAVSFDDAAFSADRIARLRNLVPDESASPAQTPDR